MDFRKTKHTTVAALALLATACSTQKKVADNKPQTKVTKVVTRPSSPKDTPDNDLVNLNLPEVPREFRAAWVATVANINWPSKNNLSTAEQKAEAVQILDMLKSANFNAVVFQARPSSDALYKSNFESWSYFLGGVAGKAPDPYYDPLEFWISEAHRRGMQLHVWLNPFRAYHTAGGPITDASMVKKMPDAALRLKNGTYWMDPANPKVQDHVSDVVRDLVKRYDIDAVHFDDYFYPYAEYNGGKDFPDSQMWSAYQSSGGSLSKAEWRRGNVNKFVKRIYDEIHAEKKFVKFGISPFGIWKSGYPQNVHGSSQYDELFADAKLWLNQGWVDYFSPQLYWKIGGPQDFGSLLDWWKSENNKKRHLWPGLNTVGVRGVDNKAAEISSEIRLIRNNIPGDPGEIHYSVDGISKNYEMLAALRNLYKEKALIPASPWLSDGSVVRPEITAGKNSSAGITLSWLSRNDAQVESWILYLRYGDSWLPEIIEKPTTTRTVDLRKFGKSLNAAAIKAVDRNGMESEYSAIKIQ